MYYVCTHSMSVNVNGIYYVHACVCEQACWVCSVGTSAIENLCVVIIMSAVYYKCAYIMPTGPCVHVATALTERHVENLCYHDYFSNC